MLKPEFTGQFKKDYKLAVKRGCNPKKLEKVISLLCSGKPLPETYQDHPLNNSKISGTDRTNQESYIIYAYYPIQCPRAI